VLLGAGVPARADAPLLGATSKPHMESGERGGRPARTSGGHPRESLQHQPRAAPRVQPGPPSAARLSAAASSREGASSAGVARVVYRVCCGSTKVHVPHRNRPGGEATAHPAQSYSAARPSSGLCVAVVRPCFPCPTPARRSTPLSPSAMASDGTVVGSAGAGGQCPSAHSAAHLPLRGRGCPLAPAGDLASGPWGECGRMAEAH